MLCVTGMTPHLFLLWAALGGFAAPATATVVARVNDTVIDRPLVLLELSRDPAARYHSLSPEKQPKYEAAALERLIDHAVMRGEALRRGLAPGPAEIDAKMKSVVASAGGDERFDARLAENGLTRARFRDWVSGHLAVSALEAAVRQDATVSVTDVADRYAAQASEFVKPASAEVSMLYFRVMPFSTTAAVEAMQASAITAANEWRPETDPEALAKRLGARYVNMGVVHEGAAIEGLEEAVAQTAAGAVTGPVKTVFGYHVVRIGERTPARQMSLDEVRPQIEAALREKRAAAALEALRLRLRGGALIVRYAE